MKRVSNFRNNNYIEYESKDDRNKNLSLDESKDDRNKNLSLEEWFIIMKHYLRYTIIDLQASETWKIQLTNSIKFISSKDAEEEHVIHSKSDNIKFTSYYDANEVVDEP